jgi:phosphoribosylcarboxyaminoimidazole (NCAIR) mutase
MLDARIVDMIKNGKGFVGILAGSGSDDKAPDDKKPSHIGKIVEGVETFRIPYGVNVYSAHKQPTAVLEIIGEYNQLAHPILLVAVAGGTDALSGTAAWHSIHPVLSCPPDAPNQSCLTNPPGSSNIYIARPGDVGRVAAQMFSHLDPAYAKALRDGNDKKVAELLEDNTRINGAYLNRMVAKYAPQPAQQGGQ